MFTFIFAVKEMPLLRKAGAAFLLPVTAFLLFFHLLFEQQRCCGKNHRTVAEDY